MLCFLTFVVLTREVLFIFRLFRDMEDAVLAMLWELIVHPEAPVKISAAQLFEVN